jgi:hypothetical protein
MLQIQQYVKELNSLESRRGRKPLDINNVVYWFKNARAAQKRAELRGVGPGELRHLDVSSPLDGRFKRRWPSSLLSAGTTWVISKVLHTVCFLLKSEIILQNTFTGLQCNLHCTLSQRSKVWASLVFLSERLRC